MDEASVKKDLEGLLLDYVYPSGLHYTVHIKPDKLDFTSPWPGEQRRMPPPPKPGMERKGPMVIPPAGGVDYRARKLREGLYEVHWIVESKIHVALIFDFENKRTMAAALMPGQTEQFEEADWERWVLPSENLKKYQGKGHK